jgi:hypothetical protein
MTMPRHWRGTLRAACDTAGVPCRRHDIEVLRARLKAGGDLRTEVARIVRDRVQWRRLCRAVRVAGTELTRMGQRMAQMMAAAYRATLQIGDAPPVPCHTVPEITIARPAQVAPYWGRTITGTLSLTNTEEAPDHARLRDV